MLVNLRRRFMLKLTTILQRKMSPKFWNVFKASRLYVFLVVNVFIIKELNKLITVQRNIMVLAFLR